MILWQSDETYLINGINDSLEQHEPDAFAALPEPYQNDNCLSYRRDYDGLYCRPHIDQVFALGRWTLFFNEDTCSWENNKNLSIR